MTSAIASRVKVAGVEVVFMIADESKFETISPLTEVHALDAWAWDKFVHIVKFDRSGSLD